MVSIKLQRRHLWKGVTRLSMGLVVAAACTGVGCLNRPIEPVEPKTTTTIVERLTQSAVDKIDILLAIDNSRSMADKQEILALAVPDLVERLVNPICVSPGDPTVKQQVPYGSPCPSGLEPEFEPVADIHIGIISSSIGGHGSDACLVTSPDVQSNDDKGRLLARTDPGAGGMPVTTYGNKGFLAWDPTQKLKSYDQAGNATPAPGEADINVDDENLAIDTDMDGNPDAPDTNNTALVPQLRDMVIGVGQVGCGYEAQLESWYRFLADPEPYDTISVQNGNATPEGIDTVLLTQRADFLRPNSLLAIIVLSDENDCSIRESGQFYLAAQARNSNQTTFHLPAARAVCATNPNDACCKSCGQPDGDCGPDPTCKNPDGTNRLLTDLEDSLNLRCFDQKRRFGIDFLYSIDRYAKALTDVSIANRAGDLVPNPIFSDLNPHDEETNIRDSGLVFYAAIVGVPWQDIARQNAGGTPDLLSGLDKDSSPVGGFKDADELRLPNGAFASTWDIILGDPANYVAPADPLMLESVDPRSGTNPITGSPVSAPSQPPSLANSINGNEWDIQNRDDLQYACIFDLATPRDCAASPGASCDCRDQPDNLTSPLCELDPGGSGNRTYQVRAKAYPGIRELWLAKGLGGQGIVGSVCPEQQNDPNLANFGYRPAVGAIIDRLKTALGGQCLPRTLIPDKDGNVPCLILEVRNSQGACSCNDYPARKPVDPENKAAADAALADPIAAASGWDCVCEIEQLQGAERTACQDVVNPPVQVSGVDVDGWCYIDATTTPPTGDPAIVDKCPETEKRIIRFVGKGEAQPGATLFITCAGVQGG